MTSKDCSSMTLSHMWKTRKPTGLLYNLNITGYSEAEIFKIIRVDSSRKNELKLHKSNLRTTVGKDCLMELDRL